MKRAVLELTERGRALDKIRAGTVEAAVVRMLAVRNPQEVALVREVLVALVEELGKG